MGIEYSKNKLLIEKMISERLNYFVGTILLINSVCSSKFARNDRKFDSMKLHDPFAPERDNKWVMNDDDFDWSDRSLHMETRPDGWIKYQTPSRMSSFHTKPGTVPDGWKKSGNPREMSTFNTDPGTFNLNGSQKMEGVQGNNTEVISDRKTSGLPAFNDNDMLPQWYMPTDNGLPDGVPIMNDDYRPEQLLHDSRDDAEFINGVNADNKNLIGRLSMESIENNLLKSVLNSETQFCRECVSKGTKLGIQIVIQSNSLQNQKKFENFEVSIQRNVQTMDRLVKACEVCLLNMPDAI